MVPNLHGSAPALPDATAAGPCGLTIPALSPDQKALLEVFRLSDVPRDSTKTEAERAEELTDADLELLEELPEELQKPCASSGLGRSRPYGSGTAERCRCLLKSFGSLEHLRMLTERTDQDVIEPFGDGDVE